MMVSGEVFCRAQVFGELCDRHVSIRLPKFLNHSLTIYRPTLLPEPTTRTTVLASLAIFKTLPPLELEPRVVTRLRRLFVSNG